MRDGPARDDSAGAALNAAQQEVLARLRRPASERPEFDAGVAARLRRELEEGLAAVAEKIDPAKPLFVSKHKLAGVFGCEASFMHDEQQPFAWNPYIATGAVAHKAIELGINWRPRPGPMQAGDTAEGASPPQQSPSPPPPELTDAALESLTASDSSLADWLYGCSDTERADVRSLAISRVSAFWEGWPPLKSRWYPVTESRSRVELCDGRIQLSGKYDLALGRSDGRRAGKVIVDLKAGRRQPHLHRDDLRFYALVETLKLGTPPRTLATYYLESAHIDVEEVTEALLDVARNRTIDGIGRFAELEGRLGPPAEPLKRPGPPCRWCALQPDCTEGQNFLADHSDD